jgi:hypothetical protein
MKKIVKDIFEIVREVGYATLETSTKWYSSGRIKPEDLSIGGNYYGKKISSSKLISALEKEGLEAHLIPGGSGRYYIC